MLSADRQMQGLDMGTTMQLIGNLRAALIAATSAITLTSMPASADPVQLQHGRAELSTSGLVIDLPAIEGRSYNVSASWSIDEETQIFDTRDVIDEFDSNGNLILGTWVQSGFFDAGSCADVLAEAQLDAPWNTTVTLWGETWTVHGGIFTFTGSLGRRPAAKLCRDRKDGTALLLHHYLVDRPESIGQAATMEAVARSEVMAAASRSYTENRIAKAKPLLRPEVRSRGEGKAARTVSLNTNMMMLDLPEDGYVWLAFDGDGADYLERAMPSLPPVSVELIALEAYPCADLLASFHENLLPDHRPANLPAGWVAGNGLNVNGDRELIMCHATDFGALLVGVFQGTDRDVSFLHPLMAALLKAAGTR